MKSNKSIITIFSVIFFSAALGFLTSPEKAGLYLKTIKGSVSKVQRPNLKNTSKDADLNTERAKELSKKNNLVKQDSAKLIVNSVNSKIENTESRNANVGNVKQGLYKRGKLVGASNRETVKNLNHNSLSRQSVNLSREKATLAENFNTEIVQEETLATVVEEDSFNENGLPLDPYRFLRENPPEEVYRNTEEYYYSTER